MSPDPIAHGLPHRPPFIFVDEVAGVVAGERAECRKRFAADEPFFAGHFPGDPLVPGVILTEALAQTAGIAAGRPAGHGYRLAAVRQMKFTRAVRPGEPITLLAEKAGGVGGLLQFSVRACVNGETAAEGVVVLADVA